MLSNSGKRLSIKNRETGERILGVEGGGTKTAWVLVETVTVWWSTLAQNFEFSIRESCRRRICA